MFCMNCGKQYEEGLKFCPYCGAKAPHLEEKTAVVEPAEQMAPVWSREWANGKPVPPEMPGSASTADSASSPPPETAEIPAIPYGEVPNVQHDIPEWSGGNGTEPLEGAPSSVPFYQL